MSENNFRSIQSIGRTALIEELMEDHNTKNDVVIEGYGDDTAVLEKDDTSYQLVTSETFTEGVDFDLTYIPLHHLGYKIVSATLSDIYAMNGTPETLTINLAVPNKISVDMLKAIYKGFNAASADYKIQIVGGDLTASHQVLSVSASATGSVEKERITYRKSAQVDDAICITGDLGSAIAGLRILMREKEFWQESGEETGFQPDLEEYEYVVKKQLVPKARVDTIQQFAELGIIPTSMIDISQGLASEIKSLSTASGVGAQLFQAAVPIALDTRRVADEMQEEVDKYALYGGEDLELLFTLPEEVLDRMADELNDIRVIGKIVEEDMGITMQTAEGDTIQFDDV